MFAPLLEEEGIKADVYDGVEIEPTDRSMEEAAEYARQRELDGLIAVGGGSALDTCKAVNLLTTYPAPLLDYINQPVGSGRPVPGPLKPLIAVPTTAGTGSETTAVAVTHVLAQHVKAGVSNRLLRPALGIVDPLNTLTAPPGGDGRGGLRHPDARDRVLHDAPVQRARQASSARSPGLHRRQPGQRHLVREGDRVRRPVSAARAC